MKDSQKRYYAHASKCERCLASIEQGRVNTFCRIGWQVALDVLRELDDPHEGRAYPGQVWVDNIRQSYVEWLADTAGGMDDASAF